MKRNKTGFTVIEIVAVIVILGVIAGAGIMMLSNIFEGYMRAMEATEITQKGQFALTKIAVELEHVNATTDAIHTYSSSSIDFTGVYNNGTTTERYTLSLNGGTGRLMLGSDVISDMVTNLQLNYFEADGVTAATSEEDIRVIGVQLSLQGDLVPTKTFSTRIAPPPMQR